MGFIFNRKKKVSKDGTKVEVIRYAEEDAAKWQMPADSGKYLEEMDEHIRKIYPCKEKQPFVMHEILSNFVHIDVNIIPPEGERDYYVLWTSGMSDLPMTLPDGDYDKKLYERAELLMYLPADWKFNEPGSLGNTMEDYYYWPLYWIKYLARFPHEYRTWLGTGHTLPNGEEYAPLGEGTKMGGFFFLPAISLGKKYPGVETLNCKDGIRINFLWAIPMYQEEIEYKLEAGYEEMLDLMGKKDFPRVIDPMRKSMLK